MSTALQVIAEREKKNQQDSETKVTSEAENLKPGSQIPATETQNTSSAFTDNEDITVNDSASMLKQQTADSIVDEGLLLYDPLCV